MQRVSAISAHATNLFHKEPYYNKRMLIEVIKGEREVIKDSL
jgi:hypothetical protein